MPDISTHAAHRLQKRSIPPRVIDWLHLYGSKQYDGHGAVIRFLIGQRGHAFLAPTTTI